MPDGVPEGFDGLPGEGAARAVRDGDGDHDGDAAFGLFVEDFFDGEEGSFGVEGVEDGFDEEGVYAAVEEGEDLVAVGEAELFEGDGAEAGVVDVR